MTTLDKPRTVRSELREAIEQNKITLAKLASHPDMDYRELHHFLTNNGALSYHKLMVIERILKGELVPWER